MSESTLLAIILAIIAASPGVYSFMSGRRDSADKKLFSTIDLLGNRVDVLEEDFEREHQARLIAEKSLEEIKAAHEAEKAILTKANEIAEDRRKSAEDKYIVIVHQLTAANEQIASLQQELTAARLEIGKLNERVTKMDTGDLKGKKDAT